MNRTSAQKALLHKLTGTDRVTIVEADTGTFGVPYYDYNVKAIEAWIEFGFVELVERWYNPEIFTDVATLRLTDEGKVIVGFDLL